MIATVNRLTGNGVQVRGAFYVLEHLCSVCSKPGNATDGVVMSKRLGKRERAKLRISQGQRKSVIAHNVANPPERGLLSSPTARDTLLTHSHSGFRDPKGNLAKAHVERAAPIGDFRFVWFDPATAHTYGGSDRVDNLSSMRRLFRERASDPVWTLQRDGLLRLRVMDTKPWLTTERQADILARLNKV